MAKGVIGADPDTMFGGFVAPGGKAKGTTSPAGMGGGKDANTDEVRIGARTMAQRSDDDEASTP